MSLQDVSEGQSDLLENEEKETSLESSLSYSSGTEIIECEIIEMEIFTVRYRPNSNFSAKFASDFI